MSHNPQVRPPGPARRPRRLRGTAAIRDLVRENELRECDLILPLFVSEKIAGPRAVDAMPGIWQQTLDGVRREAEEAWRNGAITLRMLLSPALAICPLS